MTEACLYEMGVKMIVENAGHPSFSNLFENILCDIGIVQFAELLLPAPSVIRGPRLMGLFVRRVFHWVRS